MEWVRHEIARMAPASPRRHLARLFGTRGISPLHVMLRLRTRADVRPAMRPVNSSTDKRHNDFWIEAAEAWSQSPLPAGSLHSPNEGTQIRRRHGAQQGVFLRAMASISTRAPRGRAATPTVARAG